MVEARTAAAQKRRRLSPPLRERARALRVETTIPERLLWGHLRAGRLAGLKWRRQHVIGPYVVDFFCPTANLVVEIDGRTHIGRVRADAARTRWLKKQGLRVIRFTDDEVLRDLEAVVVAIAVVAGVNA